MRRADRRRPVVRDRGQRPDRVRRTARSTPARPPSRRRARTTLPTVWIPDSIAWINRVQIVDRAAFFEDLRSVASSPVVVAVPEPAAAQIGWPAPLPVAGGRRPCSARESSSSASPSRVGRRPAWPPRWCSVRRWPPATRSCPPWCRPSAAWPRPRARASSCRSSAATRPPRGRRRSRRCWRTTRALRPSRWWPRGWNRPGPSWTTRTPSGRASPGRRHRRPSSSGPSCSAAPPRPRSRAKGFRAPDGTVGPWLPVLDRRPTWTPSPGRPSTTRPPSSAPSGCGAPPTRRRGRWLCFDVTSSMGTQVGNGATRAAVMVERGARAGSSSSPATAASACGRSGPSTRRSWRSGTSPPIARPS